MKSHTGGTMSLLGKGSIYSTLTKQKLNTKSSTEAELVRGSNVMPQILWTKYFLEAQGYGVKLTVLQDNQSTILLEKNGQASSSKQTCHINIRYFFVTDCVASGEVGIEYCPTKEMLANYFTKPLQGALFKLFRDIIMNGNSLSCMTLNCRSVLKHKSEQILNKQDTDSPRNNVPRSYAEVVRKKVEKKKGSWQERSDKMYEQK